MVMFFLLTAVLCCVLCVSSVTAYSHWTVSGNGFHRTATYSADFSSSILHPKEFVSMTDAAEAAQMMMDRISVTLSVPADFYIDVNELWKRSSFSLVDECGDGFIFHRYPASRWRFAGSSADSPIDLEGPSFRTATVPRKTAVTLTFQMLHTDAAAAEKEGVMPLRAMQPRLEAGLNSHVCAGNGNSRLKMALSFPVHARYATPVGAIPSSFSVAEAFSLVNLALVADHILGRAKQNHRFLNFDQMQVTKMEHHGERARTALPKPDRSRQRNEIKEQAPFFWRMPVANAKVATFVWFVTTALVIVAACGVMLAAVL